MSGIGNIPFLDLVTPHLELESELTDLFRQVLTKAAFVGGPMVEGFEREFAKYCSTSYAIAVNSGTDALRFALIASGVKPGDVVLTVPNTFIATTEAITQAGALPEFIDVDERTYNISWKELSKYLENQCCKNKSGELISRRSGRRVTAIVPVHLYGQTADMDPILELAEQFGLKVIEDACQAHGAEYFSKRKNKWMKAGSMGIAAAFSFYPGKNLGACGEAGAVTTNNAEIAKMVSMLRDHGQSKKYYHKTEGYNGRIDALQAGILTVKLGHLPCWNESRRSHAKNYNRLLSDKEGILLPYEPEASKAVYHLYVVQVQDRIQLQNDLAALNIGTGIHYPIPLHLQDAYETLGYKVGDYPVAERAASHILSLPMYPELSEAMQERVVAGITKHLSAFEQAIN